MSGVGNRDAAQLAYALVASAALPANARVLAVKGSVSDMHRVRPSRVSADVDILVEPAFLDAVVDNLGCRGWAQTDQSALALKLVDHSSTLVHRGWPIALDIHKMFPGMLADPAAAFDALWADRSTMTFAGIEVPVSGRVGSILITALHSLRNPGESDRHRAELDYLCQVVVPGLSPAEKSALTSLAIATGSVDTARPVLGRLGLPLPAPTPHGASVALDKWRVRSGVGGLRTVQLWNHVGSLPWREQPSTVFRALWQSDADFLRDHPGHSIARSQVVVGKICRIGRGLGHLPRVLVETWRHKRAR